MTSQSNATIDHDTIKQWAEKRDGCPASVRGTEDGDAAGVLRIDFPGGAGEDVLEHITWEEWFAKFEDKDLAFVYQEEKVSGEGSTFFKLVARANTDIPMPEDDGLEEPADEELDEPDDVQEHEEPNDDVTDSEPTDAKADADEQPNSGGWLRRIFGKLFSKILR